MHARFIANDPSGKLVVGDTVKILQAPEDPEKMDLIECMFG